MRETQPETVRSARPLPKPGRAQRLICTAYGVAFEVHASGGFDLELLYDTLPFATVSGQQSIANAAVFRLVPGSLQHRFDLFAGTRLLVANAMRMRVLKRLEQELLCHVGVHAPGFVFLHAGVVGWRGRAVLLPGLSHAGKTTLVAELVRAGATYFSDDYALLDREGKVHPYARELRMRAPGASRQTRVGLDRLRGIAAVQHAPVAQVLFTNYAAGGVWNPVAMSPGEAVLGMLQHTLAAKHRPAEVMATLAAVMRGAQAARTWRGEARPAAAAVLSALEEAYRAP